MDESAVVDDLLARTFGVRRRQPQQGAARLQTAETLLTADIARIDCGDANLIDG
jgi:hypothetical protein